MEACYHGGMEDGGVLHRDEVWRRATIGVWSMEACYHRGISYGGVLR